MKTDLTELDKLEQWLAKNNYNYERITRLITVIWLVGALAFSTIKDILKERKENKKNIEKNKE